MMESHSSWIINHRRVTRVRRCHIRSVSEREGSLQRAQIARCSERSPPILEVVTTELRVMKKSAHESTVDRYKTDTRGDQIDKDTSDNHENE